MLFLLMSWRDEMDRVYESKKGFSKKGYTDNITKVTKFYRKEVNKGKLIY